MLGAEGHSRFQQRNPRASLRELKFAEFSDMVKDLFLKCRNVIVDRVKFFTRRQKPNESLELFHGVLSGLAAKCQLAQLEKELVRDVFISNIHVVELQQKFCKKLIAPDRMLALAIEYERGIEDQKSLTSCSLGLALPTLGTQPPADSAVSKPTSDAVCAVQTHAPNRGGPSRSASSFSSRGQPCRNCDGPFNPGHQTSCPAKSVQCRNCHKKGHFARVCRSAPASDSRPPSQPVRIVPPRTPAEKNNTKRMRFVHHSPAEEDDEIFADEDWSEQVVAKVTRSSTEDGEIVGGGSDVALLSDSSLDDYRILGIQPVSASKNKRYLIDLIVGSVSGQAMIDSGSPISFVDFPTATAILEARQGVLRTLPSSQGPQYNDFNGNEVLRMGVLTTTLQCGSWSLPLAEIHVLQPQATPCLLLGADLMPLVGLGVTQRAPPTASSTPSAGRLPVHVVHAQSHLQSQCRAWAQSKFPALFTRTDRTKSKTPFVPTQQKGRRVPVAFQSRVEADIHRLIAEGHIQKLRSCTDDQFISPIVITVKRDDSLKLALDSKQLNLMVCKNKYQMPNIAWAHYHRPQSRPGVFYGS